MNPEFSFDPNMLFYRMLKFYNDNRKALNPVTGKTQRVTICNSGGSRSGKSVCAYDMIIFFCNQFKGKKNLSIYVIRKTLKSCREKAYDEDFIPHLKRLGIYQPRCERNSNQSPEYKLWGSSIKFIGLDNDEELAGSDIVFINEALDINSEKTINNQLMRCEKLAILDWNPKLSYHFLFGWEGRFNTLFTRTTWRDNKFIPENVLGNILSYCPWDTKDFDDKTLTWLVPENERAPHPINVPSGTASLHDYMVYDLGMSCPEQGAVFKDVKFIDSFPDNCDEVHFGLDFGYTNDPSVLTKVGKRGNDVFIEYMTYTPFSNSVQLYDHIIPILKNEIEQRRLDAGGLDFPEIVVACDSADKFKDQQFVKDLNSYIIYNNTPIYDAIDRMSGGKDIQTLKENLIEHIAFVKVKKPFVTVRLANMKKYNLHVVKYLHNSENMIKDRTPAIDEFTNYVYQIIEGRETNIPIDQYNHGIDSSGYAMWQFMRWKV